MLTVMDRMFITWQDPLKKENLFSLMSRGKKDPSMAFCK